MASSSIVTLGCSTAGWSARAFETRAGLAGSTALCCPSSAESGRLRIRQSTPLITIRPTGLISMAVEEYLTRPWLRH